MKGCEFWGRLMKQPMELQELKTIKSIQEPRELVKMATVNHCLFGPKDKWWIYCDREDNEWEGYLWLRRN